MKKLKHFINSIAPSPVLFVYEVTVKSIYSSNLSHYVIYYVHDLGFQIAYTVVGCHPIVLRDCTSFEICTYSSLYEAKQFLKTHL